MTIISIANQAGSAGKTTSAVTLAALAALNGRRVRFIDLDAQANATHWLTATDPTATSGQILMRQATIADAETPTMIDGLTLVPASQQLDDVMLTLSTTLGGEQRLRLALEQAEPVDLTIIDCPGSLSILTIAALVASDKAVTVTQPTVKELEGVVRFERTVADVTQAYTPKLTLAAVIPCIVPAASAGALYTEALDLLRENYQELLTPSARRSVRIPEAYANQSPLPLYAPKEGVTDDYRDILTDLEAKGVL